MRNTRFYPVFVNKVRWSDCYSVWDERLIQICSSEEDAIKYIKETEAMKIAEMSLSIVPGLINLVVRNVDEDTFYEHAKLREFFTEEADIGKYPEGPLTTYHYDVYFKRFNNETGLW